MTAKSEPVQPESARPSQPRFWHRWLYVWENKAFIFAWPAICILLLSGLWFAVDNKIDSDRKNLLRTSLVDANSLAHSYSDYLERSLTQIDQLSLLVKYEWEHARHTDFLEILTQKGGFPISQYAFVTIIDRNGQLQTGTLPVSKQSSVNDREYFKYHQTHASDRLRIGDLVTGRVSGKSVIQMTRRLETSTGDFDGVVLISVEPSYFLSFYENSTLGYEAVLALLNDAGSPNAASIGIPVKDGKFINPFTNALPASLFNQSSMLLESKQFIDQRSRAVAIKHIRNYPIQALVGLSLEERTQPLSERWYVYQAMALAATVLITLFGLAGTILAARIAWRRHQDLDMQRAYRVATEGGNDGFFMMRPIHTLNGDIVDFEVADCNERGAAFSGYSAQRFLGLRMTQLYPKPYFHEVLATFKLAYESGFYEDELEIPPESPVRVDWAHRRMVRVGDFLAFTMRDISQSKSHERELWRLANEDSITHLPNRNWLINQLPGELTEAREKQQSIAFLFIDLDNFKTINDMHGHASGNELLGVVATRLQAMTLPNDHVVRLGSDEFLIVMRACTSDAHAQHLAERIEVKLKQSFAIGGGRYFLSASIGISLFPRDGSDIETLLTHADIAMYQAKAMGKGSICFYNPNLTTTLKRRVETERALQQAIELNQFILHYQPRVDVHTGELQSMEALVRWQHPGHGLIPPAEFIPLAEETGLIIRLGELVLQMVAQKLQEWQSNNIPVVPISINVSPYQFRHSRVLELFTQTLQHYHVNPNLIEIEITESSMMQGSQSVFQELSELRKLGIKLSIDDFGTGYSSLAQLQSLEMDILKVDRAFTSELGNGDQGTVFFRAILSMAHALGMQVVAEGTETLAQLETLRALGCDQVQGFLIAKPVPAQLASDLMIKRFLMPAFQ